MSVWQKVKLAAFLFCLIPTVTIIVGIARPVTSLKPTRGMTTEEIRASRANGKEFPWKSLAPIALAMAGAVVLVVDAFGREYDTPKAMPVALALMGLLTLGMTSIVYYAVWGWLPIKREQARAEAFCESCTNASLDRSAPSTGTINGIYGTRLIGRAEPCAMCGSSIQTLWFVFILPAIPLGTYRVLPLGKPSFNQAWYLSRKMPSLRWTQVAAWLAIFVGVASFVVFKLYRAG